MKSKIKLKTFDWAMKRLLHSKANLGILEGFLTEQLKEDITILDIQDSQVRWVTLNAPPFVWA